jgi:hypothetical protein
LFPGLESTFRNPISNGFLSCLNQDSQDERIARIGAISVRILLALHPIRGEREADNQALPTRRRVFS